MIGGYVVGGLGATAAIVASCVLAMRRTLDDSACTPGAANWSTCEDAATHKVEDETYHAILVSAGLLSVGAVGFGVALWNHYHPHAISENEAKQLADKHNQSLRRTLGLPVANVELAPVMTSSSTGFALSGRFQRVPASGTRATVPLPAYTRRDEDPDRAGYRIIGLHRWLRKELFPGQGVDR